MVNGLAWVCFDSAWWLLCVWVIMVALLRLLLALALLFEDGCLEVGIGVVIVVFVCFDDVLVGLLIVCFV